MRSQILSLGVMLGFAGLSAGAMPIPTNCLTGGIALGCQAWTFKEFTVLEAIDKTAAAGGKVIEFYPGQRFSPDQPELIFDHNADEKMIAAVKSRLAERGVRAVNYGVVGIPRDADDARKIFEFARQFELYGITTESVNALDTIEKLVKEYDICVGIHNHPRRAIDPGYRVWDPHYVLSVVQDRDPRIGAAADVGHWVRSGLDPVDCLKTLEGRIISVHLKDLNKRSPDAHDVPFGTGASGMAKIIAELQHQDFKGNASIEYEYNWRNNVVDVAQCIGFVRGLAAQ